jgi:2,4-dienoyl-CoA reductase-like NADH-dependent reductase (Old Yellow Enzyme family)
MGLQLAHAGRKGSTTMPWDGDTEVPVSAGGWEAVGPSGGLAAKFREDYPQPRELSRDEIASLVQSFADAAKRAFAAGFDLVELHFAHGYLAHNFMSPLSNHRTDDYGGSFENRVRMPLEIARAVRKVIPASSPLFVRISATDWAEGGWDEHQSLDFCKLLKAEGVDLIDVSSGGLLPSVRIPVGPAFQAPFAHKIKTEAGIATAAVGFIYEPQQAENLVAEGKADAVFLARELLRNPFFALQAADLLGSNTAEAGTGASGMPRLTDGDWPQQYLRARPLPTMVSNLQNASKGAR